MKDSVRIKIKYNRGVRDGVEVKKRSGGGIEVHVADGLDLQDKEVAELFIEKFNAVNSSAVDDPDSGNRPALNYNDRDVQVQLNRLHERINTDKGHSYEFTLHSH